MSPSESEPSTKKNRSEADMYEQKEYFLTSRNLINFSFRLFGNKDVDLRNLGEPTESKTKSVSLAKIITRLKNLNIFCNFRRRRPTLKLFEEN